MGFIFGYWRGNLVILSLTHEFAINWGWYDREASDSWRSLWQVNAWLGFHWLGLFSSINFLRSGIISMASMVVRVAGSVT